jgi:acyl carrier protein
MTADIFDRIQAIASDLFGVPANKLQTSSSPETIENWDSIQHLNLVLALEERFGIQLSPEEIEQMKSLGDTATLVKSKLQSTSR